MSLLGIFILCHLRILLGVASSSSPRSVNALAKTNDILILNLAVADFLTGIYLVRTCFVILPCELQ